MIYYDLQENIHKIEQLAKDCLGENRGVKVTVEMDFKRAYLPCEVIVHLDNKGKTTRGQGLEIETMSVSKDCKIIFKFYAFNYTYNFERLSAFIDKLNEIIEGGVK